MEKTANLHERTVDDDSARNPESDPPILRLCTFADSKILRKRRKRSLAVRSKLSKT